MSALGTLSQVEWLQESIFQIEKVYGVFIDRAPSVS